MRLAALLITSVIATAPAIAATKSGVTMPDTATVGDKHLVLNGMGLREATMLKVDVYVAGLYLEKPSSDPASILASNQTKVLVLHFVRDVDRKDVVKAWSEGFEKNAPGPASKSRIERLNAWMPDFHKGDTLTFTYLPNVGVTVAINGVRKGVLEGDDFARSLFSVWLGPKPPNAALKKGLLGNHRSAAR